MTEAAFEVKNCTFHTSASIDVAELADLRQQLAYHEAQDGLLSKAQDEADRLRTELAEVKRPLDEQMARLNANLTAANKRIAELEKRLALPRRTGRESHSGGDWVDDGA